ncbi:hypothetical protein KFU94_56615 [Chloroflexi bacterium TSY]|nr:hypothetical protein [Chloroflexi bacterium TSY]
MPDMPAALYLPMLTQRLIYLCVLIERGLPETLISERFGVIVNLLPDVCRRGCIDRRRHILPECARRDIANSDITWWETAVAVTDAYLRIQE